MPRYGFTLVDLLVSMAITALILVILLQLFNQVLSAWTQENKRESSRSESRSGLRLLTDDLQHLFPLPDSDSPTSSSVQRFILISAEPNSETRHSSSFAFLRTIAPSPHHSVPESADLALVLYASAINQDAEGKVSQKLWRRQFTASETYERIKKHLTNGEELVNESDWNMIYESPAKYAEPIVYDLVRCVVKPIPRTETTTTIETWPTDQLPSHLEINLQVINRATASVLTMDKDWYELVKSAISDSAQQPDIRTQILRVRLPMNTSVAPLSP